ncbi:hypothetical protein C0558_14065 [Serratia marcescens]|uniref:Uncharacterized protein n=2 Tax=Serratia TaxID=613 RepID=A0AAP8PVV1_SERMA|nr:hypothetical protein C0558_14065 [Serratia marcescens]KAB5494010.1 hypothetical protein F8564_21985 [Enterobacter sp. RJAL6]MDN2470491.1 hypothetical protein [Serratia ureilytica]PKR38295.1 hypothetical protein CU560_07930 [Serratia ureilytica]PNO39504.1 hypothetical protein MC48_013330 [Serratia marcescens]
MQTKEEKTWFFLLCDHQSKINKLIFLIFYILPTASQATHQACHKQKGSPQGALYIMQQVPKITERLPRSDL